MSVRPGGCSEKEGAGAAGWAPRGCGGRHGELDVGEE